VRTCLAAGGVRDKQLRLTAAHRDWVAEASVSAILARASSHSPAARPLRFRRTDTNEVYALAGDGQRWTPEVTIEQDLSQRELTVNATAKDETGDLIDPCEGDEDLKERLLRHTSASARMSDPVPLLCAARYAVLAASAAGNTCVSLASGSSPVDADYLQVTHWARAHLADFQAAANGAPRLGIAYPG
jgi:tRNA nucleotidyltransferase (CCA-adding enzyme)